MILNGKIKIADKKETRVILISGKRPTGQAAPQFQMNPTRVGAVTMNKPAAAVWRPPSQAAQPAQYQPYQPPTPQPTVYQPPASQPTVYQYQPASQSVHYQPQPASPHTASTFATAMPSSPRTSAPAYYQAAPSSATAPTVFTYPTQQT